MRIKFTVANNSIVVLDNDFNDDQLEIITKQEGENTVFVFGFSDTDPLSDVEEDLYGGV